MRSDDVAVPAIVDAGGVGSLLEAQVRHMQQRLQGHGADHRGIRQIGPARQPGAGVKVRSEEHTSELQSLMRSSYAVFCLKNKTTIPKTACQNRTTKKRKE